MDDSLWTKTICLFDDNKKSSEKQYSKTPYKALQREREAIPYILEKGHKKVYLIMF